MSFVTALSGGKGSRAFLLGACLLSSVCLAAAQPETNAPVEIPGQLSLDSNTGATNAAPASPVAAPSPQVSASAVPPEVAEGAASTPVAAAVPASVAANGSAGESNVLTDLGFPVFAGLIAFASLGGFLLYYCGLTRAKNCSHTSTLLLVGAIFGLTGYWIGGFAVQSGGIGDSHAALSEPAGAVERAALDHELGFTVSGHHWGLMGSSGFFLATDSPAPEKIALLFLFQSGALIIAVAALLGAGLERGRLLPMACCAYLVGVLVYPLLANWIWGGGWLAELGREYGVGHGVVDLGGACVVHETAGVLALVLAVALGPRHGRFRRKRIVPIPGHNVPFLVLGSCVLLASWTGVNAWAAAGLKSDPGALQPASFASLAAVNTLLAATGGLVVAFIHASWQRQPTEPARLCRGLLGGAVASCGCAGLIDSWAAFLIGGIAALLVQAAIVALEHKRVDDPVGAVAVHGVGGAWALLAAGLFPCGVAGFGLNGVDGPVRGLFFGGAWHQLAAQVLGCITAFVVIYVLGLAFVTVVQTILGLRADLGDEAAGLDWPETGALGYQGDIELEDVPQEGSKN